jgi:hypothetical protein
MIDLKKLKSQYHIQKRGAKRRGIEWQLTFEEWIDWWGNDIHKRGAGFDKLQMQRVADKGPYALGNIRKGYPLDNARTFSAACQNRKAEKIARERQELMAAMMKMDFDREEEKDIFVGENYEKEMKNNGNSTFAEFAIDK